MKKTRTEEGVDIYEPETEEEKKMEYGVMFDSRDDESQKTPPKIGVEFEIVNEKRITKYVCIPCGFKTPGIEEFEKHQKECEKIK